MPAAISLESFSDPGFGENAYLVSTGPRTPCWIIDPGLPPIAANILRRIREQALQPAAIVLTHAHADHIAGIPEVLEALGPLPIYIAREEKPALTDPAENLSADLGLPFDTGVTETLDLRHRDTLTLADTTWNVLDVSGHSPGGRALYCPSAALVIVGDALFSGSIGRTDFHHSSHEKLIRNIRENLLTLPEATKVFSGHGPPTTISAERRTNPFLQD